MPPKRLGRIDTARPHDADAASRTARDRLAARADASYLDGDYDAERSHEIAYDIQLPSMILWSANDEAKQSKFDHACSGVVASSRLRLPISDGNPAHSRPFLSGSIGSAPQRCCRANLPAEREILSHPQPVSPLPPRTVEGASPDRQATHEKICAGSISYCISCFSAEPACRES